MIPWDGKEGKNVDLKQLRYFLAIAEEGQITAAARRLHMEQPPLSYQLRLLEKELGVRLVERGARHIRLTGAGELLRQRASQILSLADSAKKEVMDYGKEMSGVLSIGTISSSGGIVPNRGMLAFRKNYPNIRFEIHEGNTFAVLDMLEKGIIEIGVVRTPFRSRSGLNLRYAALDPMVAAMPEKYRCGETGRPIRLRELEGRPLILYRRLESLIYEAFARAGVEPFFCCKNDDARTALLWARAGMGIAIVPKSALLTVGAGNLTVREIECRELRTRMAVIWQKQRYLSSLGRKFIEFFPKEQ